MRFPLPDGWIDPGRGVACRDGRRVELSALQTRLVETLTGQVGRTVGLDTLAQEVWREDPSVATVHAAISRLRTVLERDPERPEVLLTDRGDGYRWAAARAESVRHETIHELGPVQVDVVRRTVIGPRGALRLTAQEARLLAFLLDHPDEDLERPTLAATWGARAPRGSRAVDHAIRRLRCKIELDPDAPRFIETVHGVGYRFCPGAPLERAEPLEPLFGRADELGEILALLGGSARLVTLVGPSGIGKTLLARHVGDVLRPRLEGGVHFVDLSAARTEGALDRALAVLERGEALVILDDIDPVAGPLGARVLGSSSHHPSCRFLATGRAPLGLALERSFPVGPLALPKLEGGSKNPAVALFIDRARRVAPSFRADKPAVARLVADIVRSLDGVPLAIELAASAVATKDLSELRTLDLDRGRASADRPERHHSMRRALDGAWAQLTEDERQAVVLLATFGGTFPRAAAIAVIHRPDADALLDALVRQSWVQLERGRLQLLAPLRAYGQERANDASDAPWGSAALDRLLAWLASRPPADYPLASDAALAILHGLQRGRVEEAAAGFQGMHAAAYNVLPPSRALQLGEALQAALEPSHPVWGPSRVYLARQLLLVPGREAEAERYLRDAVAWADGRGDDVFAARARLNLASWLAPRGRHDEAAILLDAAERTFVAHGDATNRAWVQVLRALRASTLGRPTEAIGLLQNAIEINDAHQGPAGLTARACTYLGREESRVGELSRSRDAFLRALTLARRAGVVRERQIALLNLVDMEIALGDLSRAKKMLGTILRYQGAHRWADLDPETSTAQARLAHAQGRLEEARAFLVGGYRAFRERRDPDNAADLATELTALLLDQGDLPAARTVLDEVALPGTHTTATVLEAELSLRAGRHAEAHALLDRADPGIAALRSPLSQLVVARAARLSRLLGDLARAERYLAEPESLVARFACREGSPIRRAIAEARSALPLQALAGPAH